MPTFAFVTVDVFTRERFGGNQLAVFPDAEGIVARPELMQRIAREFNFSETTFVLTPSEPKHTRRVRIFTPGGELPFAGHPTIGTAFALATTGAIKLTGDETKIILEEGVGPVPVVIRATNGKPGFAQLTAAKLPEKASSAPAARDLARSLGLAEKDVLTDKYAPEGWSCGTPFLFVPVRDRTTLGRIRVRLDDFERTLRDYYTANVFVFCDDPERSDSHFRARMFAPTLGVTEDPATGSACAAFAGYVGIRDTRSDGTLRWIVEQGFEMGRPSILEVEADKRGGVITASRVGGYSVLVTKGEFSI
jgi:trans-2,3-dihydro-3-hydroxyanthranilate isomerase